MSVLLERLKNVDKIVVNNDFDKEFLIKIKRYFNFRYDIYYDDMTLFLDKYENFNNDKGLKYDEKIDKTVFLIDNISELNDNLLKFFYI